MHRFDIGFGQVAPLGELMRAVDTELRAAPVERLAQPEAAPRGRRRRPPNQFNGGGSSSGV